MWSISSKVKSSERVLYSNKVQNNLLSNQYFVTSHLSEKTMISAYLKQRELLLTSYFHVRQGGSGSELSPPEEPQQLPAERIQERRHHRGFQLEAGGPGAGGPNAGRLLQQVGET